MNVLFQLSMHSIFGRFLGMILETTVLHMMCNDSWAMFLFEQSTTFLSMIHNMVVTDHGALTESQSQASKRALLLNSGFVTGILFLNY